MRQSHTSIAVSPDKRSRPASAYIKKLQTIKSLRYQINNKDLHGGNKDKIKNDSKELNLGSKLSWGRVFNVRKSTIPKIVKKPPISEYYIRPSTSRPNKSQSRFRYDNVDLSVISTAEHILFSSRLSNPNSKSNLKLDLSKIKIDHLHSNHSLQESAFFVKKLIKTNKPSLPVKHISSANFTRRPASVVHYKSQANIKPSNAANIHHKLTPIDDHRLLVSQLDRWQTGVCTEELSDLLNYV